MYVPAGVCFDELHDTIASLIRVLAALCPQSTLEIKHVPDTEGT